MTDKDRGSPHIDPPALDASGVAKRFGAVVALHDASLLVRRGEVVALMGANGAGKSTFVKILTGALRPELWPCGHQGAGVGGELACVRAAVGAGAGVSRAVADPGPVGGG